MDRNSTGTEIAGNPTEMMSDVPMISDGPTDIDIDIETAGSSEGSCGRSYWCSSRFVEVLLCFITVPIGVFLEFGDPYKRPIPYLTIDEIGVTIKAFMYDNRETGETVSAPVMICAAFVAPILLQILLICYSKPRIAFNKTDAIHKTVCVYTISLGLTQTLTNMAKLYVGYLRPIFYDLCQPDEDFEQCSSSTGLNSDSHQARVSFPSGHASLSVCGLLLFSLFLEDTFGNTAYQKLKKMTTATRWEPRKLVRIVSVVCYAPMLVAYFILLSRVRDNHHHPADVVGGALLGGTIASFIFGIWFQ